MATKRAFITGAGYSKQVGMPLATELTALLFEPFQEIEDAEAISWLEDVCRRVKKISSLNQVNIEEFFHYAHFDVEFFKMKQHLCPLGRQDGDTPWNEAEAVESWLSHMQYDLAGVILKKQNEASRLERIDNFTQLLCPDDTVITFNYDTLIEDSLSKVNKLWNHGLNDEDAQGISVLKMHGSIDWIICERGESEKCKNLTTLFQKQDENVNGDSGKSEETEYNYELSRILRQNLIGFVENRDLQAGSWKEIGISALGAYKPLHLLPGSGLIWAKAFKALKNADEVYIMGFSFSDFDIMFHMLCCDAIENSKKVTVIDPLPNKKAINSLFGEKIKYITEKIQDVHLDELLE